MMIKDIKAITKMRTTVTIDDDIYQEALELLPANIDEKKIFLETFQTFIRVEKAKRLAALGGKAPNMKSVPRRKP